MPSLRKRVSSYFRQLSFHNEPREKQFNFIENTFINKYLQGSIGLREGPPIIYGKNPTDLPNYDLGTYQIGPETIVGSFTGPNGGLTTVQRSEKHLSVVDQDIDFIDTQDETIAEDDIDSTGFAALTNQELNLPEEWRRKNEYVYGISDSLYDKNLITKRKNGDPIADCFGIIARRDSALLAVADGVNWGEKASIAAKSAIHGCLHYLNKTIFLDTKPFDDLVKIEEGGSRIDTPIHESRVGNTREVFVCLLRAFNCAHDLILENKGMLTTLTVAVILPLKRGVRNNSVNPNRAAGEVDNYVCCVCNVGDTLAYVYSQKYGVRELTKGSHDINCNRDMRDALGALGPVDGINPELSNLTLSITTIQKGDIVMIASDGLTDNFDPNVCKFTINTEALKPKKAANPNPPQPVRPKEPTAHSKDVQKPPVKPVRRNPNRSSRERSASIESSKGPGKASSSENRNSASVQNSQDASNPLVESFLRQNSLSSSTDSIQSSQTKGVPPRQAAAASPSSHKPVVKREPRSASARPPQSRTAPQAAGNAPKTVSVSAADRTYNFLRSKTSLELRSKTIARNSDGLPFITPLQRYELTLLLIEDILKKGISGKEHQCVTAKKLCENLVSFTVSITNAKRRTLEDNDLYFDDRNGILVEVSQQEKKLRRKRGLEKVQKLPGKLDHVTVVACNVGNSTF